MSSSTVTTETGSCCVMWQRQSWSVPTTQKQQHRHRQQPQQQIQCRNRRRRRRPRGHPLLLLLPTRREGGKEGKRVSWDQLNSGTPSSKTTLRILRGSLLSFAPSSPHSSSSSSQLFPRRRRRRLVSLILAMQTLLPFLLVCFATLLFS